MDHPAVTAMCCRALFLGRGADLARVRQMARDNLALFSHLELLPDRLEDWPADSRAVVKGDWRPGRAYFRCKALGPDGLCTIYDRRPGTCRSFTPSEAEGCARCASFGTTCPRPLPPDFPSAKEPE